MPIQGGELNHNKDEKKPNPNDKPEAETKPETTPGPKPLAKPTADGQAKKPETQVPNPPKADDKNAPLKPKLSQTNQPEEKVPSSKISNALNVNPNSAPAPKPSTDAPKPSTSAPKPGQPINTVSKPGTGPAPVPKPMAGSNPGMKGPTTGMPPRPNQMSNPRPGAPLAENNESSSAIVRFFRRIKDAITGFCCQTEDSLRHVA
ncbi:hypothetical protein NEDG_00041 [Nematocida displodere]|uniref:Uncharacterized protein n=1 Tax=Nematocida displodere TaxID=1805483 RepID=A0A177EIL6_9MICR|nr:hypothetical protein NEDG_00041 [Nematocida displodere]